MIKPIAKRLIRKDFWEFLRWYKHRFGTLGIVRAYIKLLANREIGTVSNTVTGEPIFLRIGTTDLDVFDQIFTSKNYEFDMGDPQFIVDAGAHIGLASLYFANRFPSATIISVEPESSNFMMLKKNTRNYPNIEPLQAGLWSKKGNLRIQDPNAKNWAFSVEESGTDQGIPAIGVEDIIDKFQLPHIDILKMDIEGSELDVFSRNNEWIDLIRTLIIELHDRVQPGCSEALEKAFDDYSFSRSKSGENIVFSDICRNNT